MAKSSAKVSELVSMIERGEIRLPEMQRQYVWKGPRVRDLLDSLYRGYPSGAILLWETDMDIPERSFSVSQSESPYSTCKLLLDGQQRLTSLSSVIRGEPINVRGRKRPIDILFNLEHPDKLTLVTEVDEDADKDEFDDDSSENEIQSRIDKMTFIIATKKLSNKENWISVTEVFKSNSDTQFLKSAGVTDFEDPRYEKYSKRIQKLRNIAEYEYRLDILEPSLSYEEVTEIFVRVNSLGAKLRGSDLAMAQITAKWRESLSEFEQFQNQCAKRGFDYEIGTFIRALVCFATGQSRFQTVSSLSLPVLKEGWVNAKDSIEFAINYLKSNLAIDSSVLLSSPYFLIILAYYGKYHDFNMKPAQEKQLRTWFLSANAKGRYSRGSSETMLDQDMGAIKSGKDIDGMIANLRQQFGRVEIEEGDLEGRNQRSGLFKTMFLVFRDDNAKDWQSQLKISISHSGTSHKLQFHHIFPKAYLGDQYGRTAVNDIANLAFIGGKTNRKIHKSAPSDYLPKIINEQGESVLAAQCVPINDNLLEKSSYESFLKERRALIAKRLNEYIFSK